MSEGKGWQIDGYLETLSGQLHIDGVNAGSLAAEYGTPLFVFSEQRIRHNVDRLKQASDAIPCPLKVCYAAKAMSTMGILRAVKDAGIDIEVNSGGELWKALKAGFTGNQIIFNGTSKEVWELEMAIENSIYALQVDSLYELSLIEETAERLGKRANVSLRLVPEIESGTHSGLQTALLTSKFGMMPDEAVEAFKQYKDSPHLNLCGIHLHVGSQNPDPLVYAAALLALFTELDRIIGETGVQLNHVNLGGGFPVDYTAAEADRTPPEVRRSLEEWVKTGYRERKMPNGGIRHEPVPERILQGHARAKMLKASYEPVDALRDAWDLLPDKVKGQVRSLTEAGFQLLLEPGRSVVADAAVCLTSVRNIKRRPLKDINHALNEQADKKKQEDKERLDTQGGGITFGIHTVDRRFTDSSITSEHWLLTDAGFNILLSMETYKWYYHLISADRSDEVHDFPYKVAGPLCDGGDVYFDVEGQGRLPDYRMLPKEVKPGEVLALLNCGAYSLAQASQYNGRGLPPVVLIHVDGTPELIRRRDSFEDLISSDL